MSRANLEATPTRAATGETLDLFGPSIQFLTPLSDSDDSYCLIKGTVPTGVVVPIHSHTERETFYVIEGEVEGYWKDRWLTLCTGGVFDVPGGLKHGWRNRSDAPASVIFVVPMRLGRFFREIGRPIATVELRGPKPEDLQRFVEIAHAYGYWLGSPADNAAIGMPLG